MHSHNIEHTSQIEAVFYEMLENPFVQSHDLSFSDLKQLFIGEEETANQITHAIFWYVASLKLDFAHLKQISYCEECDLFDII